MRLGKWVGVVAAAASNAFVVNCRTVGRGTSRVTDIILIIKLLTELLCFVGHGPNTKTCVGLVSSQSTHMHWEKANKHGFDDTKSFRNERTIFFPVLATIFEGPSTTTSMLSVSLVLFLSRSWIRFVLSVRNLNKMADVCVRTTFAIFNRIWPNNNHPSKRDMFFVWILVL